MAYKARAWIIGHKFLAAIVGIVVVGGGYYAAEKFFAMPRQTSYVLAAVARGTVVTSVSGTGQVSALSQVEVKPKVSGDVMYVSVQEGRSVKAGTLLVALDATNAEKGVRDAQTSLQSAQIALQKLKQSADVLSLTQAQNAVANSQQSQQTAADALSKSYEDGFTKISGTFLDLPTVMSGLDDILNGTTLNGTQGNAYAYYDLIKIYNPGADQFRDSALQDYATAKALYNKTLVRYKGTNRDSDKTTIESLLTDTYATVRAISEATKSTKNFLDLVNNALTGVRGVRIPSLLGTHETNVQNYIGTVNTRVSDLLVGVSAIQNAKNGVDNAARDFTEKTQSLAKLQAGADPLDVASAELTITQRQNALRDAQDTLANSYVRAPFDGIVAKINVRKGDSASAGTAVATLITLQQVVQISLNEVDVNKVQSGDKVTLTFDAIPDFITTGKVTIVDTLGTVTQGVVNYIVTIGLDIQDNRVKPGMSVSANIVTDVHADVLMVPNAAIQTQGNTQYVRVVKTGTLSKSQNNTQGVALDVPPVRAQVTIGLSSDSVTEITSGLQEGQEVVTREITTPAAAPSMSVSGQGGTNTLRIGGFGGGGGELFHGAATGGR